MAEKKANAPKKSVFKTLKGEFKKMKSVFKTLKGEFKKIIWPDKETVRKETLAVVLSSVVLGVFIAVLDAAIKMGISFIAGIGV